MQPLKLGSWLLLGLLCLSSCKSDDDRENPMDTLLEDPLSIEGGPDGINHFVLPAATELTAVRQDPLDPGANAKEGQGKLLMTLTRWSRATWPNRRPLSSERPFWNDEVGSLLSDCRQR